MHKLLVLNGPNLNLLGEREQGIYGEQTLESINNKIKDAAKKLSVDVTFQQSNHEGGLIDFLHDARNWADGVALNAGGYTHTSVALRDAVAAIHIPVVEVHMSNIASREEFRHTSLIAPVCVGSISGFGYQSYLLGMQALYYIFVS